MVKKIDDIGECVCVWQSGVKQQEMRAKQKQIHNAS